MNSNQRELRRSAAHKFRESLDQLGHSLHSQPPSQPDQVQSASDSAEIEAVLADIEQFMQHRNG